MSNVYQDYKLGMIEGNTKFIYRPRFDMSFLYDLNADPQENNNIVSSLSNAQLNSKQEKLLRWHKFQTQYIDSTYPKVQ